MGGFLHTSFYDDCSFYTSILLACARTRVLTVALLVVFVAVKIEKRISASPS